MASSVNVGQGYEHKRFKPPALKDMYVTANYIEEVDSPASKDFKKRFRAKFPQVETYINQEAANSYDAIYLYKAGSKGRGRPTRTRSASGARQRRHLHRRTVGQGVHRSEEPAHDATRIYLIQVKADHSVDIPKVWEDIKPYWLGEVGCDLTKKTGSKPVHAEQPAQEVEVASVSTGPARARRPVVHMSARMRG